MGSRFFIFFWILVVSVFGEAAPNFLEKIHAQDLQNPAFNKSYLKSGCYVRAHWTAHEIFLLGYKPLKVFISPLGVNEKIKARTLKMSWVFHVAAAYQDESNTVWILDPVLSLKVLNLSDWLKLFENQKLLVNITGAEIYHPDPDEQHEFEMMGSTFSKDILEFTQDMMSRLFLWESFE